MFSKTFILAIAGAAAVNAQCPVSYSDANKLPGNSIFTPDGSNTPTIGVPFPVTYDGTGLSANLKFVLFRGPGNALVELGPIAQVANCGTARCSFQWTPAANLEPDTSRYGLALVDLSSCKFQFSTQFGLNAGAVRPSSAPPAPSGSALPSLSALPPRPSGSVAPPAPSGSAPPRPSGSAAPPPPPADDCDEQPGKPGTGPGSYTPPSGGYVPSNGTGYSNGTGGVSPTYRPLQSNDGARMAISAFGAIVAFSAAVMAL